MENLLQWVRRTLRSTAREDKSAYSATEWAWICGYRAAFESIELKLEKELGD